MRSLRNDSQQARTDWLQLDQQLCFALYSTSLAMTKLYKPLLAPLGLTYPQYLALLVLWERDGLGVGELGERLFLDSGTLTPLLKRMESAGWLKRERDSADERRVVVKLTPQGRALRLKAKSVPLQLGQAMQCDLKDITSLTQRLQQLRTNLLDATAGDAAAAH
ncbi:MarR family transcriptional regulator [Piscinibacter gummiphilus]|uniref:MarR family transcriptional regulator n=1 Tax=Piscinibacter gummiphilus TaxID=946333 RepID=A0ABZ0D169_9BURK|nr:MarR family transcriptional regulator [Piscinibacter gummiphilus]WOB10491.1 MarR family transcriptional regulator [Piscinibacter gummiphilus]